MLKDLEPLPVHIGRVFHQAPLAHLIEERWENGVYTQKTVWEVLTAKLFFCPIAYREIQTVSKKTFEEWMDHEKPEWEPIEDISWGEKYLKSPSWGRSCKAIVDEKELGHVRELFSQILNEDAAISLFDYASQKIPAEPGELIKHVKSVLDYEPEDILPLLLTQVPAEALEFILSHVEAIDHFACIASPEVQRAILEQLIDQNGFSQTHVTFESTVLATELDAPTKIIKGWGYNKKHRNVGIELFVPSKDPLKVEEWIHKDRGAHFAFRVKSEESVKAILAVLTQYNIKIPPFMQGKAMKNPHEKLTVLYCETEVGEHHFRLEFCHKAA